MPLLPLPDELLLLENLDDTEDPCDDEELLALPLDFTSYEVDAYELKVLAAYELKLRIGLAFNLLGDKESHVKKDHLRAQSEINKTRDLGKLKANEYNPNFDCIQTL
ncbi:hypothetical protein OH76DRAFT_1478704 [Lentinus brumalis]|uniref:Uncharacterized protein n=1 Tax=Lentinus brumalis TaxID=2498619 RepID=A0A371DRZ7_9APHY|nr:hypothetical protein OH76DRAFT_1478704 [Polyporus brumalis]